MMTFESNPEQNEAATRQVGCNDTELAPDQTVATPLVVYVPTSTILVAALEDPHLVLVGWSEKHELPVLPGGKIDELDMVGCSMKEAALRCAQRELQEEVGIESACLRSFGRFGFEEDDVRVVPAEKLKGTLVEDMLEGLADNDLCEAHYGVPDHVFVAEVSIASVSASTELRSIGFVDVRFFPEGALSASHSRLLKAYKDALLLRDEYSV